MFIWTISALVCLGYIILSCKTGNAFLSIEPRIVVRALRAAVYRKIIYLSIRALRAEFSSKIKIIRKVARNACIIVPIIIIAALAFRQS